jgi:mRNA interferase MazF
VRRGEVWWARLGDGTQRPYVILTRDVAIPLLHSIIAVPATRTVRGIPTEVELDEQDGMPHSCALTLDNLQLMPKDMFVSPICRLGPHKLREVCVTMALSIDS